MDTTNAMDPGVCSLILQVKKGSACDQVASARSRHAHHRADGEGADEPFAPGQEDLGEVLRDGKDGRDEAEASGQRAISWKPQIQAGTTHASAARPMTGCGAFVGVG